MERMRERREEDKKEGSIRDFSSKMILRSIESEGNYHEIEKKRNFEFEIRRIELF